MQNLQKHYETLEVRPGATLDEINRAYRDLVNVWHPDRYARNERLRAKAEEHLKRINAAREVLEQYLAGGAGMEDGESLPRADSANVNHYNDYRDLYSTACPNCSRHGVFRQDLDPGRTDQPNPAVVDEVV